MDEHKIYRQGKLYYTRKQYARALEIWADIVETDSDVQNYYGYCYQKGYGVQQDYDRAFYWYTRAAENGCITALNNLGICHKNGWGTPQSYTRAVEYYQKAKDKGDTCAGDNLDKIYDNYIEENKDNLQCTSCKKPLAAGERFHMGKYQDFCGECFKAMLLKNADTLSTARQKTKKQFVSLNIAVLIGLAIALGLTLLVSNTAPHLMPLMYFLIVYLPLAFGSAGAYVVMIGAWLGGETPTDPIEIAFVIILLVSIVIGAPIYTIYKLINTPKRFARLREIKDSNTAMLEQLDSNATVKGDDPSVLRCIQLNELLLKLAE